ncbi:MAG: ABC transporter ATP-binding protein, partial [Actinomycetota bacterium]
MNALATHGLSKSYGDQTVVAELDLAIPKGTLYGFLGPNGAGKTTTIRMLLGLVKPSAGRAELLGEEVSVGASAAGVLDKVGALIEEPGLWPYLSGRSNLVCMARSGGKDERLARIDEVLELVGLSDAATKRVKAYSQGMRQRLGIALALLGQEVNVGTSAAGVLGKVGALIEEPGLWPHLSGSYHIMCMARSGGKDA